MATFYSGIAVLETPTHARLRLLWVDDAPDSQIRREAPGFVKACYPEATNITLVRDMTPNQHCESLVAHFDVDVKHAKYRPSKYNTCEGVEPIPAAASKPTKAKKLAL